MEISKDQKSISIKSFYMDFDENEMMITVNDESIPVDFETNKKFNYLKFKFNKKNFKFHLYYGMGDVDFILKDRRGNLLTLKKVE
jgi:carbonic anhydrase